MRKCDTFVLVSLIFVCVRVIFDSRVRQRTRLKSRIIYFINFIKQNVVFARNNGGLSSNCINIWYMNKLWLK